MKLYTLLMTGLCLVTITIACGKKPAATCTDSLLDSYNKALNTDLKLSEEERAKSEGIFRSKVGTANCDATRAGKTVNLSAKSLDRDLGEVKKLQNTGEDKSKDAIANVDDKSKDAANADKTTEDKTTQATTDQAQKTDDTTNATSDKTVDSQASAAQDASKETETAQTDASTAAVEAKTESKTDAKASETQIDEAVTIDDKTTDTQAASKEEVLEPVTKKLTLSCAAVDGKRNKLNLLKDLTAVKSEKLGDAKIFNENGKIILKVSDQSSLTYDTLTQQTIFSSNETAGSQILLLCENADTSSCQASGQKNLKQLISDKDLQAGLLLPTKEIMLRIKKADGILALSLVNRSNSSDTLFQVNLAKNLATIAQTVKKSEVKTNAVSCSVK